MVRIELWRVAASTNTEYQTPLSITSFKTWPVLRRTLRMFRATFGGTRRETKIKPIPTNM